MNEKMEFRDFLSHNRKSHIGIFRCPNYLLQIGLFFVISLILTYIYLPLSQRGILIGISLFFIPAFTHTMLLPLYPGYEEDMEFRQAALIALISLMIVFFTLPLHVFLPTTLIQTLLIVYGATFSIRYLVIRSSFLPGPLESIPAALFQSLIVLPFAYYYYEISSIHILFFTLVTTIAFIVVLVFIALINKPYKDNFGTSAMDMIRISLQLTKDNDDGRKSLEKIFEKYSLTSDISYTLFSFKSEKKEKALFIIPNLHPGPIEGMAGAKLSEFFSKELSKHGAVFNFHGPSTHKLNPVKLEDCDRFLDKFEDDIGSMEYGGTATSFENIDKDVNLGGQFLGDGLLMTASFSPRPTEDIDAPVGKIVNLISERYDISKFGFIDSHNCIKKDCLEVYYPSHRAGLLMDRSEEMMRRFKDKNKNTVKMGVASKKGYDRSLGISDEGIKTSVFEVQGKKNAYVLIDGNNMVKGLRERIQNRISKYVDSSEITTTDTHAVNTLNDDYNPVGLKMSEKRIIKDVEETVKDALDDLEEVEVGVSSGEVKDFPVMGPITSEKLSIVSETVYRVAPYAAGLAFSLQAVSTYLVILLI